MANSPDPSKIPDMTLGERSEKPGAFQPSPAPPKPNEPSVPTSYAPQPITPLPAPAPSSPPGPADWQEGDRVLAPWEPEFLYPGAIRQIMVDEAKGDQALIRFDDGGEGWVFVYSICPREVNEGQRVQVRRHGDGQYFSAEILKVSEDEVRVRYDDGSSAWTPIKAVRMPCVANGPGAAPTKLAPWQTPANTPAPAGSGGIPSWAITIGIIVLLAFIRIGCRAMQ